MTKIEWVRSETGERGRTWNPIAGCSIVSPGCTNCYAMGIAARIARMNPSLEHYRGLTKPSKAGPVWTGVVQAAPDHILTEPLRRRTPTTWFVNSMSDLFHEDVPAALIDRVFAVMALCPQHTFQVLTKRPARMLSYIVQGDDEHGDYFERLTDAAVAITGSPCAAHVEAVTWPLPNVWLGTTAERQQEADARIPDLLATPAAVRFVSAEPLLGPIRFEHLSGTACLATPGSCCRGTAYVDSLRGIQACERAGAFAFPGKTGMPKGLDWIICGGESGPNARPMHPDWARSVRDQCQAAGVPFFFKQWGHWCPDEKLEHPHISRVLFEDAPPLAPLGKARAGRLLDGREWNEMPGTRAKEPAP